MVVALWPELEPEPFDDVDGVGLDGDDEDEVTGDAGDDECDDGVAGSTESSSPCPCLSAPLSSVVGVRRYTNTYAWEARTVSQVVRVTCSSSSLYHW